MKTMKVTTLIFGLLSTVWLGLGINSASAQTRTWVSGVGDDSNPCSRTQPCQTWAGALSKTLTGGEIDALDAGGFGTVTITKSITLDGGGGQVASILVSGTDGIDFAGPNDVVKIRNLSMNRIGVSTSGIHFISGAVLHIENCNIMNLTNGILLGNTSSSRMIVTNTFVTSSSAGGLLLRPTGGTANVAFLHSETSGNTTFGLKADDSLGGAVTVMIKDSSFINNTTNGIETNGTAATVLVGSSVIAVNQTGVSAPSGAILSYGTNQNNANIGSNGSFAGVLPPE